VVTKLQLRMRRRLGRSEELEDWTLLEIQRQRRTAEQESDRWIVMTDESTGALMMMMVMEMSLDGLDFEG
jgi:hypothetical protein